MISKLLNKIDTPVWLEWLFGIVFLLRIPSFFEPYNYGDEMIYVTLGNAVRKGLILYKDIHDNKPPFLYLVAALAGNLFWFKVILAAFSLVALYFFWKLATRIFEDKAKAKVATVAFAILTTLPTLEGNIANAENFMILFTIAGFFVLLSAKQNFKSLFLGGMFFSFAALFKIPAAFDLPAIFVYWFLTTPVSEYKKLIRNVLVVSVGFIVPIFVSFVWFYFLGAGTDYIKAAFAQNVGYLSSWRPSDVQKPFIEKNAPLLIRGAVVAIGSLLLFIRRKHLSREFMFASAWLLFSLFAVTLSERPYPHYLLQAVPAACFLIAIFIKSKTVEQSLVVIPLGVLVFVPFYYKFWYYPTFPYYERFANLIIGKVNKTQYMDSFGGATSTNYEISSFVEKSTGPDDRIFVWGDSPAIYALTRRLPAIKYTAAYHILEFSTKEELVNSLYVSMPKLIVILMDSPSISEINSFLNKNYVLISTIGGARIWHLSSIQK